MPASALFDSGLELFNRGQYYEAHEVWEDLWRETEGPLRKYYQGLIQTAVGLYHLRRGNSTGARGQLGKALQKLAAYPPGCCGIDNAALTARLSEILENLTFVEVRIARLNENSLW